MQIRRRAPAVLADVRWYLTARDGYFARSKQVIAGASRVDLDRQLAGHDQPATEGRHPFPPNTGSCVSMGSSGIANTRSSCTTTPAE
jgi:3-mercaptopyruvate sulfurtransferase SseA